MLSESAVPLLWHSVYTFGVCIYAGFVSVSWTELAHRTEWFVVSYVFWFNTIKQVCLVEIHRQSAMATSFITTQVTTQPPITPAMKDTVWIQLQSRDVLLRNAGKASLLDAVSKLLHCEVRVGLIVDSSWGGGEGGVGEGGGTTLFRLYCYTL